MKGFNEKKALNAILFLAKQGGEIDLYALLKTIYYADKYHFQKWGRTITGDAHHRLEFGPVPTKIYDMLKSVRGDGVWDRELNSFFRFKDHITIEAISEPDLLKLSESDIEELNRSYKERGFRKGREGFNILKNEAHDDKAFSKSKGTIMTEEDLSEGDPNILLYLKERCENEQFLKNVRYFPPTDEEETSIIED